MQPEVAHLPPTRDSGLFAGTGGSSRADDGHAWPSLRRTMTRQACVRLFQAHPARVPPPHPAHQIRNAKRSANLDPIVVSQPDGDGCGGLRPRSDRILDRGKWRGRIATKFGGIPGMNRRLVARLPRHPRTACTKLAGYLVVVGAAQLVRIEKGNVNIMHVSRAKSGPIQLAPDQIAHRSRADP